MKEAQIKLKGKAGANNEDIIDFTSIGKIEIKNNSIYIEYDESELSGMKNTISTIVISEDTVTLNRTGEYISTMVFSEGQETPSDIKTPYGLIHLNIYTNKLDLVTSKNDIELKLNYSFTLGGERINNYLTLNCHY